MKERPINPLRIWAISHNVVFIYHVFGLSFVVAKGNFTEELVGILALALALALGRVLVQLLEVAAISCNLRFLYFEQESAGGDHNRGGHEQAFDDSFSQHVRYKNSQIFIYEC